MCSIGEDDFGDEGGLHTMTTDPPSSDPPSAAHLDVCKSCNSNICVVKLPCKEPQCANCFLAYVRHKFRANIGSNKMIPRNGRVLVVYDAGANSSVLLDMLRFATTLDRFKKLHVEPVILYVDEQCLGSAEVDPRNAHLDQIKELLGQFGFPSFYVSIADICKKSNIRPTAIDDLLLTQSTLSEEATFVNSFNAFKSLTSKQEFLHCSTTNIIRECAEKLDCKFAFTSEMCPDLAIKLLSNICLGRGLSVGQDLAFCDSRKSVRILRPIRDFSTIEITNYLKHSDVRWLHDVAGFGSVNDEFGSIQNLTKGFVDGLQDNFQSTISTVFRTGSKIAAGNVNHKTKETLERCGVCASPLDCEQSATLMAINFSRMALLNDTAKTVHSKPEQSICYGCRNMFKDGENVSDIFGHE